MKKRKKLVNVLRPRPDNKKPKLLDIHISTFPPVAKSRSSLFGVIVSENASNRMSFLF